VKEWNNKKKQKPEIWNPHLKKGGGEMGHGWAEEATWVQKTRTTIKVDKARS